MWSHFSLPTKALLKVGLRLKAGKHLHYFQNINSASLPGVGPCFLPNRPQHPHRIPLEVFPRPQAAELCCCSKSKAARPAAWSPCSSLHSQGSHTELWAPASALSKRAAQFPQSQKIHKQSFEKLWNIESVWVKREKPPEGRGLKGRAQVPVLHGALCFCQKVLMKKQQTTDKADRTATARVLQIHSELSLHACNLERNTTGTLQALLSLQRIPQQMQPAQTRQN